MIISERWCAHKEKRIAAHAGGTTETDVFNDTGGSAKDRRSFPRLGRHSRAVDYLLTMLADKEVKLFAFPGSS